MNRLIVLVCMLALLLPRASHAEPELDGLAEYIEASMHDWKLPGLAVAVVHEDERIFCQGFGIREIGSPEPVDCSTLFQIGSTSKAFAAASVGVLVDQGRLAWDTPIVEYLPWFRMADPWVARHVTLRDLLTHRSGLQDAFYPVLAPMDAREVAEKIALLDNTLPFRQQHAYTNFGYGLAGLVVEAVSDESWARVVERSLMQPLGMDDSGGSPYNYWDRDHVAPVFLGTAPAGRVSHAQARQSNVAMPHGLDRSGKRRVLPWMSYDNMAAAGSVVSNARDMSQWLRMLLAGGRIGDRQLIESATLEEILSPQLRSTGSFLYADEGYAFYGMGWGQERFRGHRLVAHGGGIFGFPAFVALIPDAKIGVVVLANGSTWTPYYPHHEVVAWVAAKLLGLPAEDWHGKNMRATESIEQRVDAYYARLEQSRDATAGPDRALRDFAGRYRDRLAGDLLVEYRDGSLSARFEAPGAFSGSLEHWAGNQFRLWYDGGDGGAFAGAQVSFETNDAGDLTGLDAGFLGHYERVAE